VSYRLHQKKEIKNGEATFWSCRRSSRHWWMFLLPHQEPPSNCTSLPRDFFQGTLRQSGMGLGARPSQGSSHLGSLVGRQHDSAKYITAIAGKWHSMPRDYRSLLSLPGVGLKVTLVTIYECFKDGQGAPCDVHMVHIFKALGWMPTTISLSDSWVGKETSQHEFARAAIEGWFPKIFWSKLNQTWAGLGQLFRNSEDTSKMAKWVDRQAKDWNSTFRLS
jgi:hypothetical protein